MALADIESADGPQRRLNVLLLADDRHEANVVQDHINALRLCSQHNIFVVNPIWTPIDQACDLSRIDVILVHYSILVLSDYFLPQHNAQMVKSFSGPKLQIIQDEYRWVNQMKRRIVELGIEAVFSSLNVDNLRKVYADLEPVGVHFYSSLPGYIPAHMHDMDVLPIAERRLDICYRGRELPFWIGRQAREKSQIGLHMQRLCGQYGGAFDIEVRETARIYGKAWVDFIASSRTTLGVEGGASIFDFEGNLPEIVTGYLEEHPGANFEQVFEALLKPYEGNVVHRTITPRIFEAIALKTALVLYPGRYSGLLQPDVHYIPFNPDGSGDEEVARKIKDHVLLQEMVDRTYADIVKRPELQASFYVEKVDAVISRIHRERELQK